MKTLEGEKMKQGGNCPYLPLPGSHIFTAY